MTDSDKLRFELGKGFNVLSEETIRKLVDTFHKIYKSKTYNSEFFGECLFAYLLYKDPEAFVQVMSELKVHFCGIDSLLMIHYRYFKDLDFLKYAYEYIHNSKPIDTQPIYNEINFLSVEDMYLNLLNNVENVTLEREITFIEKLLNF